MQTTAWEILTEEEQTALSLSINHGKSSWEGGEILKKAHYKYLEIHARATHFFKIFTLYLKKTDGFIVPPEFDVKNDFREFIDYIIRERRGYRETLKLIGKKSPLGKHKATDRNYLIIEYMDKLMNHEDETHRELHDLILEFDRWNNFRILPEYLQEPSAFRRRNKARLLKHLKNTQNIPEILLEKLYSRCRAPKSYTRKVCYLPIVNENKLNGYEVITIKHRKEIITYISKNLCLYMFKDKDQADEYGFLLEEYLNSEDRHCKIGQTFWPKYREIIKRSINYDEVNNIIPRRTNLENSFINIDKAKVKKMEAKAKRAREKKFWDI